MILVPLRHISIIQRFGMAEQAINTIYLLGEQPDTLCGDIIRSLTRAVFSGENRTPAAKTPGVDISVTGSAPSTPARGQTAASEEPTPSSDIAQAFYLSQLVFLVGHVAFKHIVYLELVEREIKRRKEVLAKGSSKCSVCGFSMIHRVAGREKAGTGLKQVDKQRS